MVCGPYQNGSKRRTCSLHFPAISTRVIFYSVFTGACSWPAVQIQPLGGAFLQLRDVICGNSAWEGCCTAGLSNARVLLSAGCRWAREKLKWGVCCILIWNLWLFYYFFLISFSISIAVLSVEKDERWRESEMHLEGSWRGAAEVRYIHSAVDPVLFLGTKDRVACHSVRNAGVGLLEMATHSATGRGQTVHFSVKFLWIARLGYPHYPNQSFCDLHITKPIREVSCWFEELGKLFTVV